MHRHGHVAEGLRDRRLRLVHRHGHLLHAAVTEGDVRDPLGQGLDEVHRLTRHHRGHPLRELAVVDRIGHVVGGGGLLEGEAQPEVDRELLPLRPLVRVDAVAAEHGQPCQHDLVEEVHASRVR